LSRPIRRNASANGVSSISRETHEPFRVDKRHLLESPRFHAETQWNGIKIQAFCRTRNTKWMKGYRTRMKGAETGMEGADSE
jgi:hypothetical protein